MNEAEAVADMIHSQAIAIAAGAPIDLREPDEDSCRRCGAPALERYCDDCDLEMAW